MWSIIKREVISNILSFRFGACLLLCLVLTALTMPVLLDEYKENLEDYNERIIRNREELDNVKTYSSLKPKIERLPEVFSIFNKGIESQFSKSCQISEGRIPVSLPEDETADPLNMFLDMTGSEQIRTDEKNELLALFPSIDLITIIQIILSLLCVIFSFDAISGERERGTLRMLLSNGISRSTILIGKILGGYFGIALSLVLTFILLLIFLTSSPYIKVNTDIVIRLGLLFVSTFLYLSFFFLFGLLFSSTFRKSRISLLLCLAGWIVLVIVIPNMSPTIAHLSVKIPSDKEYTMQVKDIENIYNKAINDFYEENEPARYVYTNSSQDTRMDGQISFAYTYPERILFHVALVNFSRELRGKLVGRITAIREKQAQRFAYRLRVANRIGMISPSVLYAVATSAICGSDLETYQTFISAARQYRNQVMKYIDNHDGYSFRYFTNIDYSRYMALTNEISPSDIKTLEKPEYSEFVSFLRDMETKSETLDLDDFPRFQYKSKPLTDMLPGVIGLWGILILFSCILFVGTFVMFIRYDPR